MGQDHLLQAGRKQLRSGLLQVRGGRDEGEQLLRQQQMQTLGWAQSMLGMGR